MDGFGRDQWNNIDRMVYFILFDGTEQSCWAYLCTLQPRAQYGRLPKLSKTVYEIYDSLPLLALLSSAHRVKLSAFLRAVFSVLCECCIPNKLLTIAPGVVNFGLL